MAGSEDDQIL